MTIHRIKAWPGPFADVLSGAKRAEVRINDRNYQVGDVLVIREFKPESETYTGRSLDRIVSHVQTGFGLPDGVVVLSLQGMLE